METTPATIASAIVTIIHSNGDIQILSLLHDTKDNCAIAQAVNARYPQATIAAVRWNT